MLMGIDGIGIDLNPLARLIAEGKSDYNIKINEVMEYIEKFNEMIDVLGPEIPEIKNMDFWFNKGIAIKLGKIRAFINSLEDKDIKLFFKIAFGETVRESSNTRKNEFKLVRYNQEKLMKWNPDPFMIMNEKLHRNLTGLGEFTKKTEKLSRKPEIKVYGYNSVDEIPNEDIKENSADIVLTSAPYGDSHTTVAYCQYSHLSSEWLSLSDINIDKK